MLATEGFSAATPEIKMKPDYIYRNLPATLSLLLDNCAINYQLYYNIANAIPGIPLSGSGKM